MQKGQNKPRCSCPVLSSNSFRRMHHFNIGWGRFFSRAEDGFFSFFFTRGPRDINRWNMNEIFYFFGTPGRKIVIAPVSKKKCTARKNRININGHFKNLQVGSVLCPSDFISQGNSLSPPLNPSETPGGVYLHVVDDVIVYVLEVVHSNCLQLITSLYRIQCVIRCLLIIC